MTQTEIIISLIILLVFGFLGQFRTLKPKSRHTKSSNEVRAKIRAK